MTQAGDENPAEWEILERNGPAEGRPLVDTVTGSKLANMKETTDE